MAIGDPYATLLQFKGYLQLTDAADDERLTDALNTASRGIEKVCQRQFNKATVASLRKYRAASSKAVRVDDFHTTTDLVVSVDGTAVAAADYDLHPVNSVVDGQDGWPFNKIESTFTAGGWVEVTAQWGWVDVPAPIKQACLIVAAETYKLKDAPFGVAGFGDFGAVRVRENPLAMNKLAPYMRQAVLVA